MWISYISILFFFLFYKYLIRHLYTRIIIISCPSRQEYEESKNLTLYLTNFV